jgi:uncharacterized protein
MLQDAPRSIARGFALGIFVGMTPTMGIQMVIAGFLATVLKWNPVSAVLGVWITTPATAPFIYGANYFLGVHVYGWLTGDILPLQFKVGGIWSLLSKAPKVFLILLIGGILLGLPLAVVSYYVMYGLIIEYRKDEDKILNMIKHYWAVRDHHDDNHHPSA